MKYVKQFGIIIAISFVGELMHFTIPLPIPASIYGLVIMLVLLGSGRLRLESVKSVSSFFIEIMPMLFIPAAVGLMNSWDMIQSRLLPYIAVTIVSLITVMVTAGRAAQFIIKKERNKR